MKASSAPCSLQRFIFSSVDAAAITFAPMAFPSSTVARPTPPAAPRTSKVSPSFKLALCLRAYNDVPYVIGNAAAVSKLIESGIFTAAVSGTTIFSANAPIPVIAKTLSPTFKFFTSSAIASTTPDDSPPGIKGNSG